MRQPQYNVRFTDEDRARLDRLRALKRQLDGVDLDRSDLIRAALVAWERELNVAVRKLRRADPPYQGDASGQ